MTNVVFVVFGFALCTLILACSPGTVALEGSPPEQSAAPAPTPLSDADLTRRVDIEAEC